MPLTDTEKLEAIAKHASEMSTIQDQYAVGLAADVLAIIDGTVTGEQVEAHCSNKQLPDGGWRYRADTVGAALARAKAPE